MSTAIRAAGRWLNQHPCTTGPLPARHHGRRAAGAAVTIAGLASMLASGAHALLGWLA